MQQRRGACTSGREQEEEEERWKKRGKRKGENQGQFRKADANVTMASAANVEDPEPPQNTEFSFHTLTSDADLEH